MKKLIALLLVLALGATTLVGCSDKPASENTKPSDGSTTASVEDSKPAEDSTAPADTVLKNTDIYPLEGKHKLVIATSKEDANKADFWNRHAEIVGVDVEWKTMTPEQVPLSFLGEDMPDVYWQSWGIEVPQINEYGQGGLLINYMDYLDQMPNLKALYEKDPEIFDAVKDANGNVYTLPYICDTLTMAGNLFYVRTDMAAEAGWETLPTTTDDYLKMIKDMQDHFSKDDPTYIAMVANGPESMGYTGPYARFFFPAFGELMDTGITTDLSQKKIEVGFATEQFKHYLEFMHACYTSGAMDPECFVTESATNKAKLAEGSASINPFATYLTPDNFESGEMDFQVMPALTSQYVDEAHWALPNHYMSGSYMISADCQDLEAALAFMDAAYAPRENPLNEEGTIWSISLWLGELGVDYELNEKEGSYAILPHEGYDSASSYLHIAGSGSAPCLVWPYYENSGTGMMKKALGHRDVLAPTGVEIFYTNLLTLTLDEQDIYNDCWNDISNYVAEMNAAFITGQKDIEKDWDNYIETLESMDLQDIIDIYQAALDRYYGA